MLGSCSMLMKRSLFVTSNDWIILEEQSKAYFPKSCNSYDKQCQTNQKVLWHDNKQVYCQHTQAAPARQSREILPVGLAEGRLVLGGCSSSSRFCSGCLRLLWQLEVALVVGDFSVSSRLL